MQYMINPRDAGEPEPDADIASSRMATAENVALELSRLARLAGAKEFELLAYLLEMALLEAWREASEGVSSEEPGA